MGKEALAKIEELLQVSRINNLINKKDDEEKKKNTIIWILAIIGTISFVAGISYLVYKFFTPNYLEDYEEDYDDDFEDDYFEDDENKDDKSE